jgi:hypothetical protein
MDSDLIATREYEVTDEGGVKSPFIIFLFKPIPDGEDWRCKVEVHEMGNIWTHKIMGVDSLQCINHGIMILKTEVSSFQEKYAGRLMFLDQADLWI